MPETPPQDDWKRIRNEINALPDDQRLKLLTSFMEQDPIIEEPEIALLSPLETLKKNYNQFPHHVRMNAENIIVHLQNELKDYLKKFGADKDYIYLNEFRKIEKRSASLIKVLSREHNINPKIPQMSGIIPTVSVRVKKEKTIQAVKTLQEFDALLSQTSATQINPQNLTA